MDGSKQMLWNIFCALVRPSTLEHHRQQGKYRCFLPIWICIIQWYVHFFWFWPQIPFLGRFGPKNQNCQFILKFGTWTNSNMQNSGAMFNFSAFDWNYSFWANLVQIIKIVSLSRNLVLRLIPICRIEWGCSLFYVLILNTFFGHIWSKNSNFFVQGEICYLD